MSTGNDQKGGRRVLTDSQFYRKNSRKFITMTQKLIWVLTINGILWIWCSYILAWFDKIQIAESLSSNVCNVIIGQTIAFLVTNSIQNIFRYNPKFGGESSYPEDVNERSTNATTTHTDETNMQ